METKLRWTVSDESECRPGFCCLAVREELSGRLICDTADEPLDYPQCVERAWRETRLIAAAPALLDLAYRIMSTLDDLMAEEKFELLDQLNSDDMVDLREAIAQAKGTEPIYYRKQI